MFKNIIKLLICLLILFSCNSCKKRKLGSHCPPNAMILSGVHDPANLIRIDSLLMMYASPIELNSYNLNSKAWSFITDDVYHGSLPEWDQGDTAYWAPSVYQTINGDYRLYHSAVSDEESGRSRIGFATISGIAPELKCDKTIDFVIESEGDSQPFAIDPAVFRDDSNRNWLVYGSHGPGIYITELDEFSGLLKNDPSDKVFDSIDYRFTRIAVNDTTTEENLIEAAYIFNHPENQYYYLFVNWGSCCNGLNSTYNIRVGRSLSPTGPFLDRDSVDMNKGGGTLFLDAKGNSLLDSRYIGPGHAGIYIHSDNNYYFSHHFYDGNNQGTAALAIWKLEWVNSWPSIDPNFRVEL